jgi:putative endonuclease
MFWPFKRRAVPKHLRAGLWGEKLAADFLAKKGCKVLGRRVRFGGQDEIDLVVRDRGALVFVEVKTRAREDFGRAASAVDSGKRRSLSRAAVHYMQRLRRKPDFFRFDIVEVVGIEGADDVEIRHIESAFNLDARYRLPW